MKKLFVIFACAGAMAIASQAQVLLSGGLTYSQNFDSLASSTTTTTVPWADNSTLPGWYASRAYVSGTTSAFGPFTWTSYRVAGGENNSGAIYSFGTNGVNPITDRALGSISSGTPKTNVFGIRIKNDTASAVSTITVSYTGEEWRNGGNTAVQTLAFSYGTSSVGFASPIDTAAEPNGGWTGVAGLNFNTPIVGATAGVLDGNDPANRTVFSPTVLTGVTLNPGDEIFLRWRDIDDSGNDHGFGIDDFSVSFSVVPEPSTVALAGLGFIALISWRRCRR